MNKPKTLRKRFVVLDLILAIVFILPFLLFGYVVGDFKSYSFTGLKPDYKLFIDLVIRNSLNPSYYVSFFTLIVLGLVYLLRRKQLIKYLLFLASCFFILSVFLIFLASIQRFYVYKDIYTFIEYPNVNSYEFTKISYPGLSQGYDIIFSTKASQKEVTEFYNKRMEALGGKVKFYLYIDKSDGGGDYTFVTVEER